MLYICFPLFLRNVEDLLHERGIDVSHETVRVWRNRFGAMFAAEIRKRRVQGMRSNRWGSHLDEVFVKINAETHYLCRAVEHEGEVLEAVVSKRRDPAETGSHLSCSTIAVPKGSQNLVQSRCSLSAWRHCAASMA